MGAVGIADHARRDAEALHPSGRGRSRDLVECGMCTSDAEVRVLRREKLIEMLRQRSIAKPTWDIAPTNWRPYSGSRGGRHRSQEKDDNCTGDAAEAMSHDRL
jgi:hypothetical protein